MNRNNVVKKELISSSEYLLIINVLRQDKAAIMGLGILLFIIFLAIFAPLISPYDPFVMDLESRASPPSFKYLLGTDEMGRDVFSRCIYGARVSLYVGFLSVFFSMTIGTSLGILAGYKGGKIDELIMRAIDTIMSFPPLLLAIALVASLGPGINNVILALSVVYIPQFSRLARGSTLSVKEKAFIMAAKSLGISDFKIIVRHILRNIIDPLIVQATMNFGYAIIAEANLSFLGLGVRPPQPSWGLMVRSGLEYLPTAPTICIVPGTFILLTCLGINLLGDGLRDAIDPHIRYRYLT